MEFRRVKGAHYAVEKESCDNHNETKSSVIQSIQLYHSYRIYKQCGRKS